jgi:hypothetical protein
MTQINQQSFLRRAHCSASEHFVCPPAPLRTLFRAPRACCPPKMHLARLEHAAEAERGLREMHFKLSIPPTPSQLFLCFRTPPLLTLVFSLTSSLRTYICTDISQLITLTYTHHNGYSFAHHRQRECLSELRWIIRSTAPPLRFAERYSVSSQKHSNRITIDPRYRRQRNNMRQPAQNRQSGHQKCLQRSSHRTACHE